MELKKYKRIVDTKTEREDVFLSSDMGTRIFWKSNREYLEGMVEYKHSKMPHGEGILNTMYGNNNQVIQVAYTKDNGTLYMRQWENDEPPVFLKVADRRKRKQCR